MNRKELNKAIKEFSHKTNFYEFGLIRQLLKYRESAKIKAIENIPKIKCPYCGSANISIDDDGGEYFSQEFLTCKNCWESFDDENGYIDAIKLYDDLSWTYKVETVLRIEEVDINKYEWKIRCKDLILRELRLV